MSGTIGPSRLAINNYHNGEGFAPTPPPKNPNLPRSIRKLPATPGGATMYNVGKRDAPVVPKLNNQKMRTAVSPRPNVAAVPAEAYRDDEFQVDEKLAQFVYYDEEAQVNSEGEPKSKPISAEAHHQEYMNKNAHKAGFAPAASAPSPSSAPHDVGPTRGAAKSAASEAAGIKVLGKLKAAGIGAFAGLKMATTGTFWALKMATTGTFRALKMATTGTFWALKTAVNVADIVVRGAGKVADKVGRFLNEYSYSRSTLTPDAPAYPKNWRDNINAHRPKSS